MVDERPEETELPQEEGRAKREPPTIDLKATEVSNEPPAAAANETGAETEDQEARDQSAPTPPRSSGGAIVSFITAVISGAAAAVLVIGAAWYLGWTSLAPNAPAVSKVNAAGIDDLTARVASIESKVNDKTSTPPASESGTADVARIETLEKSVEALRGEIAGLQASPGKPADAVTDEKGARVEAAPPPDLTGINDRLAQLERTTQAQSADIAQQGAKAVDARAADAKAAEARAAAIKAAAAKPADDIPLRRAVIASLLDISVRQGDPYAEALTAAKSLAPDADALKPLDGFASSGVPTTNALSRELLTLVPKLSPRAPENATTGAGIIDRLQAGAARLVRIERTDAVGNDRGAIVARVTAAALRNDSAEARRELKTLSAEDRAAAQLWIDKADARDAALAASRQFSGDAMAALAKPSQ